MLAETGTQIDSARHCEQPQMNLVATIAPDRRAAIAAQLNQGNGGELHPSGGHRPKFCSAFSSCALAVNTFAPFEAQRSAGLRGYKPNLRLVAEPTEGAWLYVESKCLEYLRPHRTAFSDAFVAKADKVLAQETASVYADFAHDTAAGTHGYELVDAAQPLKHFLAAKLASGNTRKITLVYLFWESADAADHPRRCGRRSGRGLDRGRSRSTV